MDIFIAEHKKIAREIEAFSSLAENTICLSFCADYLHIKNLFSSVSIYTPPSAICKAIINHSIPWYLSDDTFSCVVEYLYDRTFSYRTFDIYRYSDESTRDFIGFKAKYAPIKCQLIVGAFLKNIQPILFYTKYYTISFLDVFITLPANAQYSLFLNRTLPYKKQIDEFFQWVKDNPKWTFLGELRAPPNPPSDVLGIYFDGVFYDSLDEYKKDILVEY
jgi:hypothetical protein